MNPTQFLPTLTSLSARLRHSRLQTIWAKFRQAFSILFSDRHDHHHPLTLTDIFSSSSHSSHSHSQSAQHNEATWRVTSPKFTYSKCLLALLLLFLHLTIFTVLLHLLSRSYQDGRSYLLESTPLLRCSGNPIPSIECAARTSSNYVYRPTSLIWPRERAPKLQKDPKPKVQLMMTPLTEFFQYRSFRSSTALVQRAAYPSLSLPGFFVVSYGSSLFFDRLLNFLGSLHFFEPAQKVLVWDIGLTTQQRERLSCLSYVTVEDLPFNDYPLHVQNLFNYAWKILIMDRLSKMPHVKSFLLLDAGVELSKPNALFSIKVQLRDVGFWGVEQSNFVGVKSAPQTLHRLGADVESLKTKPFCAGGLIGFTFDKGPYERIMKAAVACALDEACIAPHGFGRGTHNFDQSILSALIYQQPGLKCETARQYREWAMSRITLSPTSYNKQVLTLRRWHLPKPYASSDFLMQNLTLAYCNYQSDKEWQMMTSSQHIGPALQFRLDNWKKQVATWTPSSSVPPPVLLLEHVEGSRVHETSPLLHCLGESMHDRTKCIPSIEAHFHTMIASRTQMESAWYDPLRVDAAFTPILRALRMNYRFSFMAFFITSVFIAMICKNIPHFKDSNPHLPHAHSERPEFDEELSLTPDEAASKALLVFSSERMHRSPTEPIPHMSWRKRIFLCTISCFFAFVLFLHLCPECKISQSWFRRRLATKFEPPLNRALATSHAANQLSTSEYLPSCALNELSCVEVSHWQPRVRLVVSLDMNLHGVCAARPILDSECATRVNQRFHELRDTVESLSSSVVKPMALHVNVYRPNFLQPFLLQSLSEHGGIHSFQVHFHISDERPRLFALNQVLEIEANNSTLVAVFPLGTEVPPLALLQFSFAMEYHRIHRLQPAVYGACGWTFMHAAEPQGIRLIPSIADGTIVDVLNSACGVVYRRSMFDDALRNKLINQEDTASHCWHFPQVWLSGAIATRSSSSQLLINSSKQPNPFESVLSKHSADTSSYSRRALIQCIRAVEFTFGDWRGRRKA